MAPPPTVEHDPSVDYYALLSIPVTSTESEIRRAYRKTSILYHPDKVAPTPANLDKFHQLQVALSLLTDPDSKAAYDQKREAANRRKVEDEALESRRRKLKEDLERREAEGLETNGAAHANGAKRTWSDREMTINRIREENRARMAEAGKKRAEERRIAEEKAAAEQAEKKEQATTHTQNNGTESVSRSVKVRWVKQGEGLEIDAQSVEDEFSAGEVEHVVTLKDKKRKLGDGRGKVLMGTAVVIFSSREAAKKAIKRGPWDGVESVEWMGGGDGDAS